MSSCRDRMRHGLLRAVLAGVALAAAVAVQAQPAAYPHIGRAATPKEIAAWDIDVRPDFKGLPKGSGSVAKGMEVWEAKCASCHGVFGESNEVFAPIVGGTTKDDVKAGRVARLTDASYPGRTTLMKLSTVSTLWDYIHRAMPWAQPKSLTVEEVYGVTAYILNMGGVVPDDFVLSDRNIANVQQRVPNRNGKTTQHGLWPGATFGHRKPDVMAQACMSNCPTEVAVASFLPDYARNAHGNLAEQNRPVGAQRGADTSQPSGTDAAPPGTMPAPAPVKPAAAVAQPSGGADNAGPIALAQKHACMACHGIDNKIVGPSFRDIAKKYAGKGGSAVYLSGKIRSGGSGVWGAIPMPPQTLSESDAQAIARWLADGARK